MNDQKKVAVLIGSLRRDSISAGLAGALKSIVPTHLVLETVPIGDMPFYNPDIENTAPKSWRDFRAAILEANAVLFIMPEYNRSVPAVLKNAIDVASRPFGNSVWNGKPAAVITLSPGTLGGFGANHHLRQSLVCLNVLTMPTPEIYLSGANALLDEKKSFKNSDSKVFLTQAMQKFSDWIALVDQMEKK
jgi:chromate reductase